MSARRTPADKKRKKKMMQETKNPRRVSATERNANSPRSGSRHQKNIPKGCSPWGAIRFFNRDMPGAMSPFPHSVPSANGTP